MKRTRIPFCEYIPDSWMEIPNKYLFEYHSSKVGADWANHQLLSLTTTGVKTKDINASGGKVPDSYDKYQTVEPGDMIFCLFDLDVSAVFSGLSHDFGMITSAYDVVRPNKSILNQNYIDYWFKYVFSNRYYKMYSKNIRYTITSDMFKSIYTPIPSLKTQEIIGDYLNEKCKNIDDLIDVENKQIESLEEYRIILITNIISKDANPTKVKYVLEDNGIMVGPFGSAISGNVVSESEGSYKVYGQWNVVAKSMQAGKNYISEEAYKSLIKYKVEKDELLVSMMGSIGGCYIIPEVETQGIIDSHIIKIRLNNNKILSEYFFYCYDKDNSDYCMEQLRRNKKGSIMDGLNSTILKNIYVPMHSLEKQKELLKTIDEKTKIIEELIKIKKSKIEKLEEYKLSLIYECVTGKKKVTI